MLSKVYPEYFVSYKIYETVREVLLKNLRESDVDKIINEMSLVDSKPDNFFKKLAEVLQKHVQSVKCTNILSDIKEKLMDLIEVKAEPSKITITKNETQPLKLIVTNKTDALLKFRVGLEQLDRKYTALLLDPVKAFTYTKIIKTHPIEPDKMYAFKFMIKPDVFGIQDIYELKKNGKLNITLGYQVEADGVDGLKSKPNKINVEIVKVKL